MTHAAVFFLILFIRKSPDLLVIHNLTPNIFNRMYGKNFGFINQHKVSFCTIVCENSVIFWDIATWSVYIHFNIRKKKKK